MHLNVMELEFDDQEQVDNKEFELEFLALTIDKTTLGWYRLRSRVWPASF